MWGAPDDREGRIRSRLYEYPKDKLHLTTVLLRQRLFGYGEQFLGSEGNARGDRPEEAELLSAKVQRKAVKDRQEVHMDYLKGLPISGRHSRSRS